MSRRIWLIASVVAVVGLAAGGIALASGQSGGSPIGPWGRGAVTPHGSSHSAPQGAEVIKVVTTTAHQKIVDADGSGGVSVGDYFVFTDIVSDPESHDQVGVDHAKCTIIFNAVVCEGTFTLFGRGDIAVEASLTETSNELAVTGGTGEFLDNGGEAFIEDLPSGRESFTFFLT
jgi:hypothetical protein